MTAWRDRKTITQAIANLRAERLSWRHIGRILGLSHERARQLFLSVKPRQETPAA